MREQWQRGERAIELDHAAVTHLLRPVAPGAAIREVVPLSGGLANTNIAVRLADRRLVLRLYQRDPTQAAKEAAIDALVGNTVPTARFLHAAATNDITGQPYAVLQWIDGVLLQDLAQAADDLALAADLGAALAAIHGFGFASTGFFDAALAVPAPIALGRDALLGYLSQCLRDGRGGARLGAVLTDRLFGFVHAEGNRLDAWLGAPCLVHADFNGSNVLIDAASHRVQAVLDWEFAFSGTPAFDFGNLLRPPLGRSPAFVAALANGYRDAGGVLPAEWRRIAAIADLYAWADFLNRETAGPQLIADAQRIIAATIG